MDVKIVLLSVTLIIVALEDYTEAHVGLSKGEKHPRSNVAENSRRFLIPLENERSDESNDKIPDETQEKKYEEFKTFNKVRLEILEQSLTKGIHRTNWIINKIVNNQKTCFGLDELRSDKAKGYFIPLARGDDESDDKKYEIIKKMASLENLDQSLSREIHKANWIIKKIVDIAKLCVGLDDRQIDEENNNTLLDKIYDEIVNRRERLDILQSALSSKMLEVDSLVNNTVNLAKFCLDEKKMSSNPRRFSVPVNNKNDGAPTDELVNNTARLEILQKALRTKMYKINSIINKTVDIAEYCLNIIKPRPDGLTRRKRDVSKVLDKAKNETKAKAANEGSTDKVSENETKVKTADEGASKVSKNVTKAAYESPTNKGLKNTFKAKEAGETTNGRRSLFHANGEKSEIQQKLLSYIYDTFNDIESKMQALNATKEQFANDEKYKIGYIMSNIDTLQVNMGNIKKEVENKKDLWSDKQILDVYDTVMKSNKVLSNLLNILGLLTNSKQQDSRRYQRF